ncbi:SDR family NAD(P)-dependent oxidoreductase [Allosphingosinicella indica]|uniref:Short-chain dehydrogenase n=1 Tax=Allosphingosinicella indica TaxID=941907 RepID=A0A1X7GML7_9SPHN|nr:SDR family NAD(P)-dependent oxidoreductase [Allosphingosinicella indica]SMF72067.1 Short-chain dehydrogenase [Allosphingosinicella indica]
MTQAFANRTALVTGASRGIGAAIAEALGREGAHVVLTARTAEGLEAVEERIHAAGGSATIAPLDLTERESIGRLGIAVSERWKSLDMLVLNAAMLGTLTPVAAIDGKEFNKVLTLNLLAQQAMIATFHPLLKQSEAGRLVAVTSGVSQRPRAYWGAYAASKAALDVLVQSYADETMNVSAIKCLLLNPGATATTMRTRAFPGEDPATIKQPAAVADALIEALRGDFASGTRLDL